MVNDVSGIPSPTTAPPPPAGGRSIGILRLWRDSFEALGPDRLAMALTAVMALVSGILETALLYLISRVAVVLTTDDDELVVGGIGPIGEHVLSVRATVALALVLLVVLVGLAVPIWRSLGSICARSLVRTRSRLIEAHLGASWAHRSGQREGHFAQMVGEYSQRTEQLVFQMGIVVVSALQILMLLTGAFVVAPLACLIVLVGLGVIGAGLRPLIAGVKSSSLDNATHNRSVVSDAQQLDRLGAEVIAYDVDDPVARSLIGQVRQAASALAAVRFRARLTPNLYQYAALGVVLGLIGVLSLIDASELSSIAPVILILIRVLGYLRGLLTAAQAAAELAPYWEGIEAEIAALQANPIAPGGIPLERFDAVEFRGVGYAYTAGKPVLADVDLTIRHGDAIGLVGPSGGGKTTFIQLLLRLRTPTAGALTVDGVPLDEVRRADWARLVAYVPQENKLVSGTIAENIAFYRSGFSLDEVVEATRRAHLHDEIEALPEGYQTVVGPGSRALSGGQCQRIGIARALLGSPQLLVLDEPTSALDVRSELLIRQTLEELRSTTTLVLVAHRPATLEICNRVARVDEGRLAETTAPAGPGTS